MTGWGEKEGEVQGYPSAQGGGGEETVEKTAGRVENGIQDEVGVDKREGCRDTLTVGACL